MGDVKFCSKIRYNYSDGIMDMISMPLDKAFVKVENF